MIIQAILINASLKKTDDKPVKKPSYNKKETGNKTYKKNGK